MPSTFIVVVVDCYSFAFIFFSFVIMSSSTPSMSATERLEVDAKEIEDLRARHGLNRVIEYVRFWSVRSASPTSATNYVASFLALYLGIYTGEHTALTISDLLSSYSAVEPLTSDLDTQMTRHADGLLCSVCFLALFRAIETGAGTLRGVVGRVQQLLSAGSGAPYAEQIAALLSSAPSNGTIIAMVDQASTISLPVEPSVFDRDASLLAPSLLIHFLSTRALFYGNSGLILDTLVEIFDGSTTLSEQRCLVLLHMTRYILHIAPDIPAETRRRLMVVLKGYMLWPLPVGDMARELLLRLTLDARAPGSLLLDGFVREVPELQEGAQRYPKNRTVHFILDAASAYSRMLAEICNAETPRDQSLRQIQQSLISNIVFRSLNKDVDTQLRSLSTAAISNLYAHAVEILEESQLLEEAEAKKLRANKLGALVASLGSQQKTGGSEPYPPSSFDLPPLLFSFLSVLSDGSVPRANKTIDVGGGQWPHREYMQDALKKIVSLYTPFATKKGSRETVRIGVLGGDTILHSVLTAYVVLRYAQPKLFDMLDVQFYVIPTDLCHFCSFIARCDPWYGRHTIYAPLCALRMWPRLYESGEHAQEGTLSGNLMSARGTTTATSAAVATLSSGQRDRSTTSSLAPRSAPAVARADGRGEDIMTPSLLVRRTFEHYVRHARNRVEMCVYRIECVPLSTDSGALAESFVIPFFSRVEIGIAAVHRVMDIKGELGDAADLPDNEKPVPKSWTGVPLTVRCNAVNPFGMARPGVSFARSSYHQLVLSNHTHCKDIMNASNGKSNGDGFASVAALSDPTAPWLDMNLLDYDAWRKASKSGASAVSRAAQRYHTSAIEIDGDAKKGFDVLVDGQYYGTCRSVRIAPLQGDSKAKQARGVLIDGSSRAGSSQRSMTSTTADDVGPITFPVMTYLPLLQNE